MGRFFALDGLHGLARRGIVDYLLILAISVIPFWRTGFKGVFNKTDLDFPLYPAEKFRLLLYTWNHDAFTGVDNILSNGLLHLPTHGIFALLDLCLPLGVAERVYFVALLGLIGWGMYFLVGTIVHHRDPRIVRAASLSAAFLYMFNFYSFNRLYQGHYDHLMVMALTPFALAFLIKGFDAVPRGWRVWVKYALIVALLWAFISSSNYGLVLIAAMVLAAYAVLRLIHGSLLGQRSGRLGTEFKYVMVVATLGLALSAWWIMPSMDVYLTDGVIEGFTEDWDSYLSTLGGNSNLLDGLCLLPPLIMDFFPFNPHLADWFVSPASMGITLGFAMLAMCAACFRRKDPHVMFFLILFLGSWAFSAGPNSPIGWIYTQIYSGLPFLRVLRNPHIFGQIAALSLAVLVGISIAEVTRYLLERKVNLRAVQKHLGTTNRWIHIALSLAILVVAVVNVYPVASGNLLGNMSAFEPPDYYYEAREWLQEEEGDFRIFMIPQGGWLERYSWFRNYDMVPLPMNIFGRPVIVDYIGIWPQSPASLSLARSTYDALYDNRQSEFEAGLSMLNVKYICVREDLLYPVSVSHEPEEIDTSQIQAILSSSSSLHLERTFGELLFYRNDYWRPAGVYPASNAVLVGDTVDTILEAINPDDFTPGESVFFLSEDVTPSQTQFIGEYSAGGTTPAPEISFQKVNPTQYQVRVTNATAPFFLVFSDSYHPQWKAFVEAEGDHTNWFEALFQEPIQSERHYIANCYANAWYVDPTELGGGEDFSITLYFQPQSWFYLGAVISAVAFVGCIGFLLWLFTRRRDV